MGEIGLKKLLLLLVMIALLAACGNTTNENIDETMAESTKQILDIFDEAIKAERSLTEDELFIVDDYQLLYGAKDKESQLTEEENRLYILVRNMVDTSDELILIESNHESYETQKSMILNVIESGEI